MSEFADRVGILVGAANGIGWAVARSLAQLGAKLVIVDLGCVPDGTGQDPDVAARRAAELEASGAHASALALDSSQPDAPARMIEAAHARYGRIDFGVYCAGFRHDRALVRTSEEEFARVLAVHLLGPVRFARELGRALLAAKSPGSIVLCASAAGFFGSAGQSAHACAGGGLIGFVKSAATELWRNGVRVNALVPTARTRLTEQLPLFEAIRADSLSPEHVAQVVSHLLSDAGREVHGEVLGVAGGRIYAFRHAETMGAFHDGPPPALAHIAATWPDVTRR